MKRIDLTGRIFDRLTVISRAGHIGVKTAWNCSCQCGNTTVSITSNLIAGGSKSCGCLCIERIKEVNTTHGMSGSKEWMIWCTMRQRCRNSSNVQYPSYGGRGITVCKRWNKFENFIADMGLRPSDKHSIDRIDNDGNYELGNCRWATWTEQARNRRQRIYCAS